MRCPIEEVLSGFSEMAHECVHDSAFFDESAELFDQMNTLLTGHKIGAVNRALFFLIQAHVEEVNETEEPTGAEPGPQIVGFKN